MIFLDVSGKSNEALGLPEKPARMKIMQAANWTHPR
jgi:hypothetical protein